MRRQARDDAVIRISDEVREADAVVALETTIVAHGFPPGEGAAVGLESERRVRAAGAVPATIGVLDGEIRVGLTESELERFDASARKAGPRELGVCVARGETGATTVGGTLAVCRAAGIRFMGTGGIGGVHRGTRFDISADLLELSRSQVVVVSSGVKSLLDVEATAEMLETLGVPVLGWRTATMPRFYDAAGGPPVTERIETRRGGRDPRPPPLGARRLRRARRAPAGHEHRRRRPDRRGAGGGRAPGDRRPGGDAVRPLAAPRAERRTDARGEQGARRRQRGARRGARGASA